MTVDPYINPATGYRWKLTATEREFIKNDTVTPWRMLARQFGVDARLIYYIKHPDKYAEDNRRMIETRKAKRKEMREVRALFPKRKKPAPKIKLTVYEQQIHEMVGKGVGVGEIQKLLEENLSQLIRNRIEIESQIAEVNKTREALFRYLDPEPVLLVDPELVLRKSEDVVHMTKKEMDMHMVECGLTAAKLAAEFKKKYSVRAIQAYRRGQSPVPKDVADLLRGYPRKNFVQEV